MCCESGRYCGSRLGLKVSPRLGVLASQRSDVKAVGRGPTRDGRPPLCCRPSGHGEIDSSKMMTALGPKEVEEEINRRQQFVRCVSCTRECDIQSQKVWRAYGLGDVGKKLGSADNCPATCLFLRWRIRIVESNQPGGPSFQRRGAIDSLHSETL